MADRPKPHPCPKCNRLLQPTGEVEVGALTFPVYQCDECIATVDFLGEPFEQALTFALDRNGHPFDPADPEGELRF